MRFALQTILAPGAAPFCAAGRTTFSAISRRCLVHNVG